MSDLLTDADVAAALEGLPEWRHDANASTLSRTWTFKGFFAAMQAANAVAYLANSIGHHPDIAVHDYNQLTITSTTHSAGGVTQADVDLVRRIDDLVA